MENRIDIGQAFRDKLDNLDKSPSDQLWSKIEGDLDKNRRKRFAFWLFPLFLFCGLSAGSYYLTSENMLKSIEQKSDVKSLSTEKTIDKQVFNNNLNESKFAENKVKNKIEVKNNSKTVKENDILNTKKINSNIVLSDKSIIKKHRLKNDSVVKKSSKSVVTSKKFYKKSKKLIRSTTEYDEYEVTRKYRFVVKKKKITSVSTTAIVENNSKKAKIKSRKSRNNKQKNLSKVISKNIAKEENDVKNVITPITLEVKTSELGKDKEVKTIENEVIKIDNLIIKDTTSVLLNKKEIIKKPKREIKPEDTTKIKKVEIKKSVLILTPFFGPTYYGSFGKGNLITSKDENSNKKGLITNNYGIYVRWMFDKKSGIRVGFGKTDLNYSLQMPNNNAFIDSYYMTLSNATSTQLYNTFSTSSEVIFTQKTSYYEIPIEGYFVLRDKKIGIAGILGISYFYLKNNTLTLKSNTISETIIGDSSNTLQAAYTINIGTCFSYKLTKNIDFEVTPSFKYQFSEIFHNKSFNPYILSLQTGFSYKL